MKSMSVLLMAFAMSLAAFDVAAQELSRVAPGDRVRVTLLARDSAPQSVLFTRSTPESLSVQRPDSALQSWSWTEVSGVECYDGRRGHAGTGAAIGALTGLVLGVAAGAALSQDEFFQVTTGEAVLLTMVTTGAGAGLGALFGAAVRTERWSQVGVPGSE